MFINTLSSKFIGFECLNVLSPNGPVFAQIFKDCEEWERERWQRDMYYTAYSMFFAFLFKVKRLCGPMNSQREIFVREAQNGGLMGHVGMYKTRGILEEQLVWPKMHTNVVRSCVPLVQCRRSTSCLLHHSLYTLFYSPQRPWLDISMDFIFGFPTTKQGKVSNSIVVDRFSMTDHFIPCLKFYDTSNVESLFVEHIVKLDGIPQTIVSDRYQNFSQSLL